MTNALRRLLLPLAAVSCLAACDPAYKVPVQVSFSKQFQTDWDKGFPAEVGMRYSSPSSGLANARATRLGYFCEAADAFVKFEAVVDETGCLPEDLEVTVWIAPAPELAQSRCQVQGGTVGNVNGPPMPVTTPEQGVSKTIKIPKGECSGGETSYVNF